MLLIMLLVFFSFVLVLQPPRLKRHNGWHGCPVLSCRCSNTVCRLCLWLFLVFLLFLFRSCRAFFLFSPRFSSLNKGLVPCPAGKTQKSGVALSLFGVSPGSVFPVFPVFCLLSSLPWPSQREVAQNRQALTGISFTL